MKKEKVEFPERDELKEQLKKHDYSIVCDDIRSEDSHGYRLHINLNHLSNEAKIKRIGEIHDFLCEMLVESIKTNKNRKTQMKQMEYSLNYKLHTNKIQNKSTNKCKSNAHKIQIRIQTKQTKYKQIQININKHK